MMEQRVSAVANSVEDAVRRAPSAPAPSSAPPVPSLGMSVAKLVIGLLLVILIIWAVSRWLKRRWPAGGSDAFRLLGTLPLGPGKSVCVVEVAGRVLVLGVGQDVHLLEVIDERERLDRLRSEEGLPSGKFDQRLSDALRQVAERRRTWLRRQRGLDEHE